MTKEKKTFQPLTSENICEIYSLLHKEGAISFVLNRSSVNKIEAIVSNVNGSNYGEENYKKATEKIVAYLYFIIKDHPFIDGNKRTAVLVFLVLCRVNNVNCHLDGYGLDSLAIFIEQIKLIDHQPVIKFVAKEIFEV